MTTGPVTSRRLRVFPPKMEWECWECQAAAKAFTFHQDRVGLGEMAVFVDRYDWDGSHPWEVSGGASKCIALEQRAFGPSRLLVVFTDRDGIVLRLCHTPKTDPPQLGLAWCLRLVPEGAAAVLVYSDEAAICGPPEPELCERIESAKVLCREHGLHLVDWMLCDLASFSGSRYAVEGGCRWWDVPGSKWADGD